MSARADRWGGTFWVLLGGAIAAESWRMDRLENLHINPWSVPGLMPGVLGALMAAFGAFLFFRSLAQKDLHELKTATSTTRVLLALSLCIGYAAGLLGRGLPFWLTSATFMFVAIFTFRWLDEAAGERRSVRRLAFVSALVATGAALTIGLLFEHVFLVRLP